MKFESYTDEIVDQCCQEINRQWEILVITRAAFPHDIMDRLKDTELSFRSSEYCRNFGADMEVRIPAPLAGIYAEHLGGVCQWLNQSFVIRLNGCLEEFGVITYGAQRHVDNPATYIVTTLRHLLGAHSSGTRNPNKPLEGKLLARCREIHPGIKEDKIANFELPIDTFLEPLKNRCCDFVRSLQGEKRVKKKAGSQSSGTGMDQ